MPSLRSSKKRRVRLPQKIRLDSERFLPESEQKTDYREVFDSLPQVVLELDKEGKILLLNKNGFQLFGINKGQFDQDLTIYQFVHKDDRVVTRKAIKNAFHPKRVQCRMMKKDGTFFPAGIYLSPVKKKGVFAGIRAILLDVSFREQIMQELRDNETRYRELFNNISSGVIVYQPIENGMDFVVKYYNKSAKRFDRLDRKVIGKRVRNIFPGIVDRPLFKAFQSVYKNGKPKSLPPTFYDDRVDGWQEHYVYRLPTGEIVSAYTDITQKKDMERRLEKRAREIEVLYRTYSHTKMIRRLADVFNSVAQDMTHAFISKEGLQVQILFDGKSHSYPKRKKPFIFYREEPLVVAGVPRGSLRIGSVQSSKSPRTAFTSEEIKLIQNVTQILVKYMYSREIIERHRKIVSKSSTGIFIAKEGVLVFVNPRFCKLLNHKERELIGRALSDFIPEYPKLSAFLDGHRRETLAHHQDGHLMDVAITMQSMDYHGDRVALGWIHDITRLKAAENRLNVFNAELKQMVAEKTRHLEEANKRLQSLNELKDDFIATTSHELRSPLTSVRGYLSFLMEKEAFEGLSDDMKDHVRKAHNNAESLNYLVNNILEVSRLHTEHFVLRPTEFDLIKLTKSIIENLSFQAQAKEVGIVFNTRRKELPVFMDFIRISQVLRNILDNAIKFSFPKSRVRVNLKTEKDHLLFEILDEGMGIPKENIEHVFEKFVQVRKGKAKYTGGTGLGLFISKNIVELHRGRITAESKQGKGSVFKIRLPITYKK